MADAPGANSSNADSETALDAAADISSMAEEGGTDDAPLLGLPDSRFLPLALQLNFLVAASVHDSWLADAPQAELMQRLATQRASLPWLSHYLSDYLDLPKGYCTDFSSPLSRVALLQPKPLQSLCLYLGLGLGSTSLRNELSGERVRRLKQALGPQEFNFATRRAPLLGTPPVFECEPDLGDPHQQYTLTGARFLSARLARMQLLRRHLVLKLPMQWGNALLAEASGHPIEGHREPMTPWVRKLINEAIPEWKALFA